jgi:hypothetical protein
VSVEAHVGCTLPRSVFRPLKYQVQNMYTHSELLRLMKQKVAPALVAVTKLHASRPRKDLKKTYFAALSQQYSVASFATLLGLSCLHSSGLHCSCCNVVRFCCVLEACNLVTTTDSNDQGYKVWYFMVMGFHGSCWNLCTSVVNALKRTCPIKNIVPACLREHMKAIELKHFQSVSRPRPGYSGFKSPQP